MAFLLVSTPAIFADSASEEEAIPELRALAGAAAWRDSLEAVRVPALPPPSETESAIVLLKSPAVSSSPALDRLNAWARVAAEQEQVAATLAGLGVTINFRYRVLVNGFGVRAPIGRLDAIARLPEVEAVIPVSYLAPAEARPLPLPKALPTGSSTLPAPATAAASDAPTPRAAHVALIDAGIDPTHPWLGGGLGPTFQVIGGADLIDDDEDPTATLQPPSAEAHGTAMAALVLSSPVLAGLPATSVPRLLAYRVVAPELVDGRVRPLARTDRVLAALDRAVDPNGDGEFSDRPEVLLVGLARGFDGGGLDPIARALRQADRLDSVVVVPAGNDGPSFGPIGTVGGVAAAQAVLSVGGMAGASTPRTADLAVATGPTRADLGPLPLLGADLAGMTAPVRFPRGGDGLATGNDPAEFRDAAGQSLVAGAIAVVARGGGQLVDKARNAAAAGALGLAVWDQEGSGAFPGTAPGDDWPIPVVGLGPRQGQALWEVTADRPELVAVLSPRSTGAATPQIAAFSSRGPTADGRLKPDLVAGSVDLLTAFPGRAPDGRPLSTRLSGTSGAAAQVAAAALRLRIDRPDLRSEDVRSLLVQAAQPVPGAGDIDQGAGILADPANQAVAIDPPIITQRRLVDGEKRVNFAVRKLTEGEGRYRVYLEALGADPTPLGNPITLKPGVRVGVEMTVPGGSDTYRARVLVVADGPNPDLVRPAAAASVFAGVVQPTPETALGTPVVLSRDGVTEVRVSVGLLARREKGLASAPLHGVRLWLVRGSGESPLPLSGAKGVADWAAGEYRFLLSERLADGRKVPAGTYRLRVSAAGPDGAPMGRESESFSLR